jgi:hypothetical protein
MFDVSVTEEDDLAALWGRDPLLWPGPGPRYSGEHRIVDAMSLCERPMLPAPGAWWSHLCGPERLPRAAPRTPGERRVAAWLELQFWWRFAFEGCAEPLGARKPALAVKLAAESVRTLVWLRDDVWIASRREGLVAAAAEFPDLAAVAARALAAADAGQGRAQLTVGEVLPLAVRATWETAALLAAAADEAGWEEVRLAGIGDGDGDGAALCDWRGRMLAPWPVERLVPCAGALDDAGAIAAAMRRGERAGDGAQAVLRGDGLLVLPTTSRSDAILRAVQCAVTDPVSTALLAPTDVARFARLDGFSVADCARRAVEEHRGWLQSAMVSHRDWLWGRGVGGDPAPAVVLGWLARAIAAARLQESVDAGAPVLHVSPHSALATLAAPAGDLARAHEALDTGDDAAAGAALEALLPRVRVLFASAAPAPARR